jgi:hypothetical protein
MKRKTPCLNGNTVFCWYDRWTRSHVVQTLDADGNQVGDADYSGSAASRDWAKAAIIRQNGGALIEAEKVS